MQAVLGRQKGGLGPRGSMRKSVSWGRACVSLLYRVIVLRERRKIKNAVFCEVNFGKNHASCVHLTYKDVDRFRNGTVHELSCLKACQISKVDDMHTAYKTSLGLSVSLKIEIV